MAEPTEQDIRASYGFVAELAKAVPEINDLLNQAVREKWTPDRFIMSVANTGWWKNNYQGQREWLIKQITDPASAELDLQNGAREVYDMVSQLGLPIPSLDVARKTWLEMTTRGMDEQAKRAHLSRVMYTQDIDPAKAGGLIGQYINDMFKAAADYGYKSTDLNHEIQDQVRYIMHTGGVATADAWKSKMIDYASRYFAPYADDIRGGKTVTEIARPILDKVSQLLEVNADSVGFDDPLMRKALTEWGDQNRAYSLREIEDFTRKDARWKTTDNATEASVRLLEEIGSTFGFLNGGNR